MHGDGSSTQPQHQIIDANMNMAIMQQCKDREE
jgi:hypothetical protein